MKNAIFIDDEEDILDYFSFCLRDLKDYDINCFNTHEEASDFVSNNKIDSLFIDWRMPDGTANSFLEKHKDLLGDCKKYIVTGELELEKEMISAVDKVIYKPFKTEDIESLLT